MELTTPIKSVKYETFSDDDDEEMRNHVVTGVGEKPADGGTGMARMKTSGEEPADYEDINGGKPTGKEGDGVKTTDDEAGDGGNAKAGMKTTGEEPSDYKEPKWRKAHWQGGGRGRRQ